MCVVFLSVVGFMILSCDSSDSSDQTVSIDNPQSPNTEPPDDDPFDDEPITDADVEKLKQEYIGLSVEQAEMLADSQRRAFRVISRDGEGLPVTADFSHVRINADVVAGLITAIQVERITL